jgi:replicative DNA helicase
MEYGLSAEFVQRGESRFVELSLQKSGKLSVNLDRFYPRDALFSLMTGEMTGEMADLIIAKNRNGPIGDVSMGFVDVQTYFFDKGDI